MNKDEFDIQQKLAYKPSALRVKIYLFLEKINLVSPIKKMIDEVRKLKRIIGMPSKYVSPKEREQLKREENFINDFEEFIDLIENTKKSSAFDTVIFSGYISSFLKGGNHFLEALVEKTSNLQLITLSQSGRTVTEREKKKIAFDIMSAPRVPFLGGYDIGLDIHLSKKMQNLINEKQYLQDAVYNIKSYHDDFGENYAEALVYYTYCYTKAMIDTYHPVCFIVHNKLYSMHDVMVNICRENNVKPLYFEFGALPGTFALEDKGQMGASHVAVNYKEFKELSISSEEIEDAKKIWDFLKESRLNRNQQMNTGVEGIDLKKDRPVILFAGQNDFDSGICPYTEYSKTYHSPMFKTSDEAVVFLADIAKKNDWNLIYKPHPLTVKHHRCLQEGLPENVIWVSDVDINEIIDIADVVVTILSQVGDISLIREKATVMLGYTQLRGKECAYEAYNKECIENTLKEALEKGFSEEQRQAFVRHIAQTTKYYLYDDLNNRKLRFGKDINACAEYLMTKINENKPEKKILDIKRGLAICHNRYELLNVFKIKKVIRESITLDILFDSQIVEQLDHERIEREYGTFVTEEEVLQSAYSMVFMPAIDETNTAVYREVCDNNSDVEIYLYDKGDIHHYCIDYKRVPEDKKRNICGIITQKRAFNIWKNKNWDYYNLSDIDTSEIDKMLNLQSMNIKHKYIYIESQYFDERKYINEMDVIEYIATQVGKENIIVKLYTKESYLRFSMRGYQTMYLSDEEWFEYLMSKNVKKHYFIAVSPYQPGYSICSSSEAEGEIYLYQMLRGKMEFEKTNSFKNFMKQYTIYKQENNMRLYLPENVDKLHMVLDYIEEK